MASAFLTRLESMLEHKRSMETGSSDVLKGAQVGLEIYDMVDIELRQGEARDMEAIAENKAGKYPAFLVSYVLARLPKAMEIMRQDYRDFVSRKPEAKALVEKKKRTIS